MKRPIDLMSLSRPRIKIQITITGVNGALKLAKVIFVGKTPKWYTV